MNTELFNQINASSQKKLDAKRKKRRKEIQRREDILIAVEFLGGTIGFLAICDMMWFMAGLIR